MAIRNGQKKGAHCHLPTITNAIPLIHRIIIKNRPCRGIGRLGQGPHRLERSGRGLGKREHEVYTAKRHGLAYTKPWRLCYCGLPSCRSMWGAWQGAAPAKRFGVRPHLTVPKNQKGLVLAVPRRGTDNTTVWYSQYHGVVQTVPRRGSNASETLTRLFRDLGACAVVPFDC